MPGGSQPASACVFEVGQGRLTAHAALAVQGANGPPPRPDVRRPVFRLKAQPGALLLAAAERLPVSCSVALARPAVRDPKRALTPTPSVLPQPGTGMRRSTGNGVRDIGEWERSGTGWGNLHTTRGKTHDGMSHGNGDTGSQSRREECAGRSGKRSRGGRSHVHRRDFACRVAGSANPKSA